MMVKKTGKVEQEGEQDFDFEDFGNGEEAEEDLVEEATPESKMQKQINELIDSNNDLIEKATKLSRGVSTNQKYIKGIFQRQKMLEDNFKILYEGANKK